MSRKKVFENFLLFGHGQIENVWMNKISSKTFTSNSGKLSWEISQLPPVRMQECRGESEIYICKGIQPSNNKFINGGGGGGYAWPGLTVIIIYVKQCLRVVSSSAKFIVRKLISSKNSTVETVLGTHRATSLADNYSKSKSPPNQSNNMDQSDWRSSQLRLLKK